MENRKEIGPQIYLLSRKIGHMMFSPPPSEEEGAPISGIQGRIIGYLSDNQDKDIFQRDIQTRFSVRRSTVTGVLQLMEKNGLILRKPVAHDARLKKLELTPKAREMHESVVQRIRATEEALSSQLTPEEKETFFLLCEKIRKGIETAESCQKS